MPGVSRPFVSEESLEEAYRQLTLLSDADSEESGTVPPWIIAAKLCVRERLESGEHD